MVERGEEEGWGGRGGGEQREKGRGKRGRYTWEEEVGVVVRDDKQRGRGRRKERWRG